MFSLRSLGRYCCLILNNGEKIYCEARRLAQLFLLSAPSQGRAVEPHGQARGAFQYARGAGILSKSPRPRPGARVEGSIPRVFPLLSAAKCHTTCWKRSNHRKSKPNWPERLYTDGEWVVCSAARIRGPRYIRQASVPISDLFRSTAFSGLRIAATSVGYCRARRNDGRTCRSQDFSRCPTCAEPACARSTDREKKSRCACEIAANRGSFVVWGATSRKADGQRNNL